MKEELKAKLRKVFIVESSEDLQLIQELLPKVQSGLPRPEVAVAESFYKSVHKLKGACRAIGLKPAEILGHQVEYLFRHYTENVQDISGEVFTDVSSAIEGMSGFIAAYGEGHEGQVSSELAERMNEHLKSLGSSSLADLSPLKLADGTPAKPAQSKEKKPVDQRLRKAFEAEATTLIESLHKAVQSLATIESDEEAKQAVDRALHAAHTLKGSSRVVQLTDVSEAAHQFESMLKEAENLHTPEAEATRSKLAKEVGNIEDLLFKKTPSKSSPTTTDKPDVSPPENSQENDYCRVDSKQLDSLFESFTELLMLRPDLENVSQLSANTRTDLQQLMREERDLRQKIGPVLHQPGFAKVASYINHLNRSLKQLSRKIENWNAASRTFNASLENKIATLEGEIGSVQFTPIADVLTGLRPMVREIAQELDKQIDFEIIGIDLKADRTVLEKLRNPLIHILRNSIDHGIESRSARLSASKAPEAKLSLTFTIEGELFCVEVRDDGSGINTKRLGEKAVELGVLESEALKKMPEKEIEQLVFSPRLSTSAKAGKISGRGMGLSSVHETVTQMNGQIAIDSAKGQGCSFLIKLPIMRSSSRITSFACGTQTYGVQSNQVLKADRIPAIESETGEAPTMYEYNGRMLPIVDLSERLNGQGSLPNEGGKLSLLITESNGRTQALAVDHIDGEQRTVIRSLPPRLAQEERFSGAFLQSGGEVALLLDIEKTISGPAGKSSQKKNSAPVKPQMSEDDTPTILVVDDSFTSRTLEVGVIESYNYRVFDAVDGIDGLSKLRSEKIDLVISDIEMPRMDGFEMLKEIKEDPKLKEIPVIMISSLEEDSIIRKGLNLGAEGYIVKKRFEHNELLEMIEQFI